MANIKSQMKRNRQNEVRRQRNKAARSEMSTRNKAALSAAEAGEDSDEALQAAIKRIDKAAQNGVIHKNTAARKKSRLIKSVNAAQAGS